MKASILKPETSHHGWELPARDTIATLASGVTLGRTGIAVGLVGLALGYQMPQLVLAALAVYWAGDIADGLIARALKHEMRTGAVLDIVCDRICAINIYVAYAFFHPAMAVPIAVYLFQFVVLDTPLSLSFLKWPLLSPNYFFLVDRPIYRYNWSMPAKAFNSAAFILAIIVLGNAGLALGIALINTVIKLISINRLWRHVLPKK